MRIVIIAGKATSLLNVAKDIAHIAQKRGHVPRILRYIDAPSTLANIADGVILIYPTSPIFCAEYMLLYREMTLHYQIPIVYYTMIEGRPRRVHIRPWMIRDVEFTTVSKYVKEKLAEVGLRVKDVVYHGLLKETIEEAEKLTPIARKHLRKMHKDKIIFGVLSHTHPRKGLDKLASAVKILSEKRKDFIVHLVSSNKAEKLVMDTPNIYLDTVYGNRSRTEIFAFLGAIDYLIVPSYCEGFCLPIVEANAMKTPAIHCSYPPLTEVSDLENNIVFEYEHKEFVNTGEGIEYEYHIYDEKELANAMDEAIDLIKNNKEEYEEKSIKVSEYASNFDAEKLYPKLLKMIGA